MGDGGELERALDDAIGTGSKVRSCCEKQFEKKKTLQKTLTNSSTIVKVLENKFGQVLEKCFVEAKKFRDSSEYLDCAEDILPKSCLSCQILYVNQKNLRSAKRLEFSATVLRRTCK